MNTQLRHRGGAFPLPQGQRQATVRTRQTVGLWLFFLMATYGPAVNIVGEFRYTELAVLAILAFQLKGVVQNLGSTGRMFVALFFLTAFAQTLADIYHAAPIDGTLKRTATYIILGLLIAGLRQLSRGSEVRVLLIVAGYCLSYLIVYVFGIPVVGRWYHEMPWRLGLGTAMTVLLGVVIIAIPQLAKLRGPLLIAMGLVHFIAGGRSIGGVVLGAGLLTMLGQAIGGPAPPQLKPTRLAAYSVLGLIGLFASYQIIVFATEQRWFPDETQKKMEAQINSPAGLLAAGRPDTATALYAISKRPITGYGTGAPDPEINAYYAYIASSAYFEEDNYSDVLGGLLSRGFELGIPSHSHIFSAWAEGGILAIWSWVFTLGVCLYVTARCTLWNDPRTALFLMVALLTVWDVIFSPGPTRMDIAVRVVVLCFAIDLFRLFDASNPQTNFNRVRTR